MTHHRYSYAVSASLDISSSVGSIIQEKIQKNIILYVVSDFEIVSYTYLTQLSKLNDVIVIHLLHPYEADPNMDSTLLFESRRIDSIRYKKALLESKADIQKYLEKNNIAYICALSTDNPVTLLNHFFKYRYAR